MEYESYWGEDAAGNPAQIGATLYNGIHPTTGLKQAYTLLPTDTLTFGACQIPVAVSTAAASGQLQKTCYKFALSTSLDFTPASNIATVDAAATYTPAVGDVLSDSNLLTGTTVTAVTPGAIPPGGLTPGPSTITMSNPWTGASGSTDTVAVSHVGNIFLEINPPAAAGGPVVQIGYYADSTSGGTLNAPIAAFNPASVTSCKPAKAPCVPLAPVGWVTPTGA